MILKILLITFSSKKLSSLNKGQNIEIRGFGTFSKKINKEKLLEIQKLIKKI